MDRTATALFISYAAAGEVVRELELLGISGEQVEVVTNATQDARGEAAVSQDKSGSKDKSGEYTLVIVRPADDLAVEQAQAIMKDHGGKVPRKRPEPSRAPHVPDAPSKSTPDSSVGGPGTTGGDPADLEGRGKNFKVRETGPDSAGQRGDGDEPKLPA